MYYFQILKTMNLINYICLSQAIQYMIFVIVNFTDWPQYDIRTELVSWVSLEGNVSSLL